MDDQPKLRRVNDTLRIVVILLGLYITLFPFFPQFQLLISRFLDGSDGYIYRSALASGEDISEDVLAEAPTDNRLVIPAIQLDEPIVVGTDPRLVHQGAWHRPNTSTPDKGSNTVIVGHRFTYNSPATFYHLDKMEVGDKFDVWWQGKEYIYEVYENIVVVPTAIEIEGPSDAPIMTLYTCTPVWTAANRLVVRARLINLEVLGDGANL